MPSPMPWESSSSRPAARPEGPAAAVGVSAHPDTRTAAIEAAETAAEALNGPCDLAIIFGSFHHAAAFTDAAESARRTLGPAALLGCTAEAVLGGERSLEDRAGLALLAMRVPGVEVRPFSASVDAPPPIDSPSAMAERFRIADDSCVTLLLADPFTTPMAQLLPALASCRGPDAPPVPVMGGMASGASQPGFNVLIVDDVAQNGGLVGVTIAGDVEADCIVSQGCRPVGPSFIITKCQGNVIQQLGGRPPLHVLQEFAPALSEHDRYLLRNGLLVGFVVDEYKPRFGRGDFLVRNVLGIDKGAGSIAVGDTPRVGQTIQFHVRDAQTATEDLHLLLDAQQLKRPPLAGIVFTCNSRTGQFFDAPGHDLAVLRERLGNETALAGFYAAGEIGPIGDRSFVHGHTTSAVLFRTR